jgi:hypothetical protein
MADFVYIGCGRNRMVFRHGNYVIKIPLNDHGVDDNYQERDVWTQPRYADVRPQYARCRLLGTILIMQFAQFQGPLSDDAGYIAMADCPEWAYAIDCCQVGYNRYGNIVAYDYGIH